MAKTGLTTIGGCPCGAVHERSRAAAVAYEKVTAGKPATVTLSSTAGSWLVPRIFVACHGIKADDLAQIAERYRFERMPTPRLYTRHLPVTESAEFLA